MIDGAMERPVEPKSPEPPRIRVAYLAAAQTTAIGGVSRFDRELQRAMAAFTDLRVIPVLPDEQNRRTRTRGVWHAAESAMQLKRAQRELRNLERNGDVDVVFHSFHWPPRLAKSAPSIGFVHDLRMIGAHNKQPISVWNPEIRLVKYSIDSWDVVCVPSQHVADDVNFLLPWVEPEVVGEGLDHLPRISSQNRNRIFITTGPMTHKRPDLARDLAVLLHDKMKKPVTVLGIQPGDWVGERDIRILHQVSDDDLAKAISEAMVCVATTSYEGFGLAVGEALSSGCPVVYSADSHLDTLVGFAGIKVDPSQEGFSLGVELVLSDRWKVERRPESQADRFSWNGVAKAILVPNDSTVDRDLDISLEASIDVLNHRPNSDYKPFWSVVIPTYNRSLQLPDAIQSVLGQSDADLELIIVDDASTDQTGLIVKTFDDYRMRYIHLEKNMGASTARNVGIGHSKGHMVAFLDSDDYWTSNKLLVIRNEVAARELSGNMVNLVVHATEVLDNRGKRIGRLSSGSNIRFQERLLSGELVQTSSVLVARKIAERVLFDTSLPLYEDWDFLIRCEREVRPETVAIIDKALSLHDARERTGRLSYDDRQRVAGRKFLRKHLLSLTRANRSAFMILRQIGAEKDLRPKFGLLFVTVRSLKNVKKISVEHLKATVLFLVPGVAAIACWPMRVLRGSRKWRKSPPSNQEGS